MKVIVKTKNKQHFDTLQPLVKPLIDILSHLKKEYGFKLPASLTLRPLMRVSARCTLLPFARAGHYPKTGYFIAINMRLPNLKNLHLSTLAHEVAHVAEALKTKRWTHGPLFKEMDERAQLFIKRRRNART